MQMERAREMREASEREAEKRSISWISARKRKSEKEREKGGTRCT